MIDKNKFDFSGYATKANLKCKDGRIIMKDAFKECDGKKVPLVWKHLHDDPSNVLGHAILENREDGVYAYGLFNDTKAGQDAKALVKHGDIVALSIYANDLLQKAANVFHGVIREVSLVMSGANPGALIESVNIAHGDGTVDESEDEMIFRFVGDGLSLPEIQPPVKEEEEEKPMKKVVKHTDGEDTADSEETVQDVFDTLSEKQKNVVFALIAEAVTAATEEGGEEAKQSDDEEGDDDSMKKNAFDQSEENNVKDSKKYLAPEQWNEIFHDAMNGGGSLKRSIIAHAGTYGIDNISVLFPDAQAVQPAPELYGRQMGWVAGILNNSKHTPFSRVKSSYADLTVETARAKGYVTAALKDDEVFGLLSRTTTPTTVYKHQKLDRDDILDITDIDVVAWLKAEMRVMLDEEIARAALVGDGRSGASADKIAEISIRPIWTDADMYAHHIQVEDGDEADAIIDHITSAMQFYRGSGSPLCYVDPAFLTEMMLLKDTLGYRIYKNEAELAAALRVSGFVEVPVMAGLNRDIAGPIHLHLKAIITNIRDYTFGADKGGQVSMFDDFDIDYNQQKYLIETRCSGALTRVKSAIVVEQVEAA